MPTLPSLAIQPHLLVLAAGILAAPVELEGALGVLLEHGHAGAFAGAEEVQKALHAEHLGEEGQRQLGQVGGALVDFLPGHLQAVAGGGVPA